MLAQKRHETILSEVRRAGAVRVSDLAVDLGVSEVTIRRDLDYLDGRGLLNKVHGGAARTDSSATFEPGFSAKFEQQAREKTAIAVLASGLVEPGDAIGITAGTTTWRLAQILANTHRASIVTNSPFVANALYEAESGSSVESATVVLTGGVRTPSDALVGPIATSTLQSMYLNTVFLGVHGVDPRLGFTTPNLAEAEVNRAFLSAADRVVVLADHTKWMTRGLAQIAPLSAAKVMISDTSLPTAAQDALHEAGVEVMLADPAASVEL